MKLVFGGGHQGVAPGVWGLAPNRQGVWGVQPPSINKDKESFIREGVWGIPPPIFDDRSNIERMLGVAPEHLTCEPLRAQLFTPN